MSDDERSGLRVPGLLERYGLRPKRTLGQNFLADAGLCEKIARTVSPHGGCSGGLAVTTVTPVAKWPITLRNSLWSIIWQHTCSSRRLSRSVFQAGVAECECRPSSAPHSST